MQKAASASYYNLTDDLLVAAGNRSARDLRRKYRLGFFASEVNCNVGPLRAYKMLWLLLPHLQGEKFAIKTHEPPSPSSSLLLRMGHAVATYIYRDPRDVAVSLFDHGERLRKQEIPSNTRFNLLTSMEEAIQFASKQIPIWQAWVSLPGVLVVRYEDFIQDPGAQAQRINQRLELGLDAPVLDQIGDKYFASEEKDGQSLEKSHFNVGGSGRWRRRMSSDEKELCQRLFGQHLHEMGYE
jgi:hypothetical protein